MRSGPLIANTLLLYAGVYASMFLILIPGLILCVAWCISTPALIVEGLGPMRALGRSARLTAGNRWPVFAVTAATWIAAGVLQLTVMSVSTGGMDLTRWRSDPLFAYVVGPVTGSVIHMILASVIVSIYIELARINERGGFAEVAEVFT